MTIPYTNDSTIITADDYSRIISTNLNFYCSDSTIITADDYSRIISTNLNFYCRCKLLQWLINEPDEPSEPSMGGSALLVD